MKYPIILIDNGHGKDTKGKRSPDGSLEEWRFARDIAAEVVRRLQVLGYTCWQLVKEDEDVPLMERAARANAYCYQWGKKNVILVSIHSNAAGNGLWLQAKGWEAWTTVGVTESDRLAKCLYDVADRTFGAQGRKVRKNTQEEPDKEKNFTIIYRTLCPAVLTENFFYDNKDDLAYMQSKEGREAIVMVHVEGIINYIKTLQK